MAEGSSSVFLQNLKQEKENNFCFDCGAPDTSYASITYGTFICLSCAAKHRAIGSHLSYIVFVSLDQWSNYYNRMEYGGNAQARKYFDEHNLTTKSLLARYESSTARNYSLFITTKINKGKARQYKARKSKKNDLKQLAAEVLVKNDLQFMQHLEERRSDHIRPLVIEQFKYLEALNRSFVSSIRGDYIQKVNLSGSKLTGLDIKSIAANCPFLVSFALRDFENKDFELGLDQLMQCEQLDSLRIEYSVIHLLPASASKILSRSKVHLQVLSFKGSLFFNERSAEICAVFAEHHPNLKTLKIGWINDSWGSFFNTKTLISFVKCQNLTYLDISGASLEEDEKSVPILRLLLRNGLRKLKWQDGSIHELVAEHIMTNCSNLEELDLRGCKNSADPFVEVLKEWHISMLQAKEFDEDVNNVNK